MLVLQNRNFPEVEHILKIGLLQAAHVDVGEWHAQSTKNNPLLVTRELEDVILDLWIPPNQLAAEEYFEPNMPWAESHFQERVGGLPLNPPPSHSDWPWDHSQHQNDQEQFSHTYPERYWPVFANFPGQCADSERISACPRVGIRYQYGDLSDVVAMLRLKGNTRQAYLPVWFPEDTGAVHGQRVPCSLGYHFLVREGKLSCRYYLRSCDFVRHFRDDLYLTARLMQWIAEQIPGCGVGHLMAYISSLHIMVGDEAKLSRGIDDGPKSNEL